MTDTNKNARFANIRTPMDLIAEIGSYYPSLTRSEQKVARRVLEHADEVLYSSITEFAEASGVGETTVIRFAGKSNLKATRSSGWRWPRVKCCAKSRRTNSKSARRIISSGCAATL